MISQISMNVDAIQIKCTVNSICLCLIKMYLRSNDNNMADKKSY